MARYSSRPAIIAALIGERAEDALSDSLREATRQQPGVLGVENILTTQLSPDQVVATLGVQFDEQLTVPQLEKLISRIETQLHDQHPDLFRVFVRPTPSIEHSRHGHAAPGG
jgi:divalent metal cation (Fe/Co/Zn/Cd) transporter